MLRLNGLLITDFLQDSRHKWVTEVRPGSVWRSMYKAERIFTNEIRTFIPGYDGSWWESILKND